MTAMEGTVVVTSKEAMLAMSTTPATKSATMTTHTSMKVLCQKLECKWDMMEEATSKAENP